MRHANLVANELHQTGFRTKAITSNAVLISLTSRKVSKQEVQVALDQHFGGICFALSAARDGVLVSW